MRLAFLLVFLSACSRCGASPVTEDPIPSVLRKDEKYIVPEGSPLRDRLQVKACETQSVSRQLTTPASVDAEPSRMAKITPPLVGRIVKLFVRFGDTVKVNDPLFLLDSPDLVAAQSDYLKAKSSFAQAERNLARQKDLVDHGIGAQRELEQAQTDRDTAKSELERTQTRLQLLGIGAGGVGGPLTVKSPIAGRVIDLSAAPGQFQNDLSIPVMIVADLTTIWVTASVQEKDLRRVHQGDDATVSFAAYPGEPFNGQVLFVGDLLDPETRTTKVRIALSNSDMRLKPGMFATVTFKGKAAPEIVVPTAAVVIRGEKSGVFVESAPWTFERRDVEVGEQINDTIVVTKGLSAGEKIVVQNAVLLP